MSGRRVTGKPRVAEAGVNSKNSVKADDRGHFV